MKKQKNIIVIQARRNSSRYKDKILKKIKNKSLLEILILRLKKVKKVTKIILCTTKLSEDDQLINIAKKNKIDFYRGSENNVLQRFFYATKNYKFDNLVRITSDCPLSDPSLIDDFLDIHIKKNVDYSSNTIIPTYPDGFDIEIIKRDIFTFTYKNADSIFDKEHVTSFIKNNKSIKKLNIRSKKDYSKYRFTIDYIEDFNFLSELLKRAKYKYDISFKEIIRLLNKNQNLININNMHLRNEGSIENKSQKMWNEAKTIIPGGNSLFSKRPELFLPGIWPTYFEKTKKNYVWGLDNKKFLDMSYMGVGTNFLGYSNLKIDREVIKTVNKGNLSTLNPPEEVFLAKKLLKLNTWAGMVKFARSGGEANTIALRIGRAKSKKNKVLFCGYHGWHDWYLSSGKKLLKNYLFENVKTEGVVKNLKKQVLCFDFNDLNQFKKKIQNNKDIGVVFMEVARKKYPSASFLKTIRKICDQKKIILIFDECTTGFREEFGGLHKKYKVYPDIVIFGKTLGNGYAINAIVGKKDVMVEANNSFISSTFWTERIGFTAANKFIEIIEKEKPWNKVLNNGRYIKKKLKDFASKLNLKINIFGIDSIPSFDFNYENSLAYKTYITQEMLKKGVLATNAIYLTSTHTKSQIDKYLKILMKCLKDIKIFEEKKLKSASFLKNIPRISGMRNT